MRSPLLPSLALACLALACTAPPRASLLAPDLDAPLADWRILGDARFTYVTEDGAELLHGHGENMPRNSFLVSEAEYGDFELELDVRIQPGGNSGVQVRSHVDWAADGGHGRLWGYQVEVDSSERAWSAGLYEEGRRGWLADLSERPEARAAFVVGEWNHYRIRCEGPRLRTWVNGVPAVDFTDTAPELSLTGHLAFQVHGGQLADVAWRNIELRQL
ncbi:MAG: DUF1080 domain-containing protein [Planctomycetota bacterium]|nr:DUF1080 domain-containing protein [Planctomycetota bacterium]